MTVSIQGRRYDRAPETQGQQARKPEELKREKEASVAEPTNLRRSHQRRPMQGRKR